MKRILLIVIAFAAIVSGCSRDTIDTIESATDRSGAVIRVKVTVPDVSIALTRGLTDKQEVLIDRCYGFCFDASTGVLLDKVKFTDLNGESPVFDSYATTSTGGVRIAVVANYADDNVAQYDAVTSYDGLCAIVRSGPRNSGTGEDGLIDIDRIERPDRLPMYGETTTGEIILGEVTVLSVPLHYLHAKITVRITDATTDQNLSFTGWGIKGAPACSYTVPRSYDAMTNTDGTLKSLAEGDKADQYFFHTKYSEARTFEKEEINASEINRQVVIEEFYLTESLRGTTQCTSYNDRSTVANKPDSAAIFSYYFTVISSNKQTRMIRMNLCLGGLNASGAVDWSDYNIRRGMHYIYNITIDDNWHASASLSTDSNIASLPTLFPIEVKASSSLTFDAHPDMRVLSLSGAAASIQELEIEILDSKGRKYNETGFDATWLKMSRINLTRPQISQNDTDANLWMQSASPSNTVGYYVRGRYIPNLSRRLWLKKTASETPASFTYKAYLYDSNATGHATLTSVAFGGEQVTAISPNGTTADGTFTSPGLYTPPTGVTIDNTANETFGNDNNISVSDIYPEYDNVLPYWLATYRMCYKITNCYDAAIRSLMLAYNVTTVADLVAIAGSTESSQDIDIYLYADEYEYNADNRMPRTAFVRATTTTSEGTQTLDFAIIQRQPMFIGPVPDSYATGEGDDTREGMSIEYVEENRLLLHPRLKRKFNLEATECMQWGSYGTKLYNSAVSSSYTNGYYLTLNAVYADGISENSTNGKTTFTNWATNGNNYRDKYGSGMWIPTTANNYAKITEPIVNGVVSTSDTYQKRGSSSEMYYYPDIRQTYYSQNDTFHPIYNSSAARYCHEKNRDLDGDGILSDWEIKWFLPSQKELYQVWISFEAIQDDATEYGAGYYWSSSEADAQKAYCMGFLTGFAGNTLDKRIPYSRTHTEFTSNHNGAVRCVRKNTNITEPTVIAKNGHLFIDCCALPEAARTTISKGTAATGYINNTTAIGRKVSTKAATVFQRFRIAKADCTEGGSQNSTNTTMMWSRAVGYNNPYTLTDRTAPDSNIKYAGGESLKGKNPNTSQMYGAKADASWGCRSYSEESNGTDKGKWRLPNKRELMMIYVYNRQLSAAATTNNITDYTAPSGTYWSATEREPKMGCTVNFSNGLLGNPDKSTSNRVRCIREDYSEILYNLYFNMAGGTGTIGSVKHNGDESVTLPVPSSSTVSGGVTTYTFIFESGTVVTISSPTDKTFGGWRWYDQDDRDNLFSYNASSSNFTYTIDRVSQGTVTSFTMPPYAITVYAVWK